MVDGSGGTLTGPEATVLMVDGSGGTLTGP
jgi:hypothetical protein